MKRRNPRCPHYSAAASLTLAAALLLLPSTPATASRPDSDLQSRIDQVLETFPPGGVQSAPNRIAWDGGNVTLTLEDDGAGVRSIGSCPTGAHCVYDQANLHGSYMTFNTCTTQSVAPPRKPCPVDRQRTHRSRSRLQRRRSGRLRIGEQLDQHELEHDQDRLLISIAPSADDQPESIGIRMSRSPMVWKPHVRRTMGQHIKTVVVTSGNSLLRAALVDLVTRQQAFMVIAACASPVDIRNAVVSRRPDLLVIEGTRMPEEDLMLLLRLHRDLRIVLIGGRNAAARALTRAGAGISVPASTSPPEELAEALSLVAVRGNPEPAPGHRPPEAVDTLGTTTRRAHPRGLRQDEPRDRRPPRHRRRHG